MSQEFTIDEIFNKGREIASSGMQSNITMLMNNIREESDNFGDDDFPKEFQEFYDEDVIIQAINDNQDPALNFLFDRDLLDSDTLQDYVEQPSLSVDDISVGDQVYFYNNETPGVIQSGVVTGTSIENDALEDQIEIDGVAFDTMETVYFSEEPIIIAAKVIEAAKDDEVIAELADKYEIESERPEIMQYFSVSTDLAHELSQRGELVAEYNGMNVWGRQAFGQAVYMDKVFKDMAKEALSEEIETNQAEARIGVSTIKGIVDSVSNEGINLKVGAIVMPIPYPNAEQYFVETEPVKVDIEGSNIKITSMDRNKSIER